MVAEQFIVYEIFCGQQPEPEAEGDTRIKGAIGSKAVVHNRSPIKWSTQQKKIVEIPTKTYEWIHHVCLSIRLNKLIKTN